MTIIFPPKSTLDSVRRLHNYLWDTSDTKLEKDTLEELYSDIDSEVYDVVDDSIEVAYVEQNYEIKAKLLGLSYQVGDLTTEEIIAKIKDIRSDIEVF